MDIPQEVLVPPTRDFAGGEETADWRARYRAAHEALIEYLRSQPTVVVEQNSSPPWMGQGTMIMYFSHKECTVAAPAFQLGHDELPLAVVSEVNGRLLLRYSHGPVPWVSVSIAQHVWWMTRRVELDNKAPIEVLGTPLEDRLVELATDMDSLLGRW